jgi:tungstate transport system ATP-binding protein
MTALFRLSNLSKTYGERRVLNVEQLEISPGHIYAIMGPNGSGKTTLLRILSLLTFNTAGQLEVFGEQINWSKSQLLRLRRQMAMVTQSSYMFEGSVYYNVAYGLRARKISERETKIRVQESLALLGMLDFMNHPANNLSGGEKQKVAIARALAVNPRVLFLDEPTSNIDPTSSVDIENYVKRINEEHSITIILVTHKIFQTRKLAKETFLMWDGRIIEQGPTRNLFHDPQDTRTRRFLKGEY